MKKLGFGKKGDDGDDSSRSAFFGRKKASPTPQSENPYAQQGTDDPYANDTKYANMTPYQQARAGLSGNQRPSAAPGAPASQGGPSTGYGSQTGGSYAPRQGLDPQSSQYGAGADGPPPPAYSAQRYGSGGGYGSNRYDSRPNATTAVGGRGPSGYGGFGRTDNAPDENRDALFSGAQERFSQRQHPEAAAPGGYRPSGEAEDAYGGYGDQRELTAEEQEEAEYQAILSEKRQVQQESVASVSRSVQMARQANEVGQATLARLGAQGERLHNTEKNLDLAANQNKIAQDRAAELKTLNRSMFAVHVGNPFTSKQRQQRADEEVMNRHRAERDQRETTRRDGYTATQRMESTFRDINTASQSRSQTGKKDYGKFNLEDEEGADELEDQIDDGLAELEGQVSMLNMVGRAIGKEVGSQNKQIDRIMTKSDAVDDATRMNRERLARIR